MSDVPSDTSTDAIDPGNGDEKMELEPSANVTLPRADRRPLIPEPIPVRLVTVDDAELIALAGLEHELDDFYIGLLRFERDASGELAYQAENFRIKFAISETLPERDNLRPLLIEVPRLSEIEHQLVEAEIDYTRQPGLMPGETRLLVQDPAGNWIELTEYRTL
jgi:hypothetical protein